MKWRLFVLICLATTKGLFSQPEIPPTFNQEMMLSANSELDDIAGTPYLYEEFKNGDIYYGGEHKMEQIPLRLNIYYDRLEYKDEKGKIMAFGNPEFMDLIVLGEDRFIYLRKSSAYKVSGFVKMWNSKFPALITKMDVKFLKGEEAKPFDLHDPKPDRLERNPDMHYIMKNKEEIEKVTSMKKLIRYLGTHNAELTDYAKNAEISTKEPEKLAMLLNYYHELEQKP